jgi:hypothetical protein
LGGKSAREKNLNYLITRELFRKTNNALTPSRLSDHELLLLQSRTISAISWEKNTQQTARLEKKREHKTPTT